MTRLYIAGIAMTVFGRHLERSLHDLAGEALAGVLKDAGCDAADIGAAYYSGMTNGALQGQISVPGQVIFSKIGIDSIPVFNVENACASGSSAFHLALQSLKAGTTDVPLAAIVAVDSEVSFAGLMKIANREAHSRLPVFRESLDDVIGMVHVKDLL